MTLEALEWLSHVQHFFKTDYTKYSVEPNIRFSKIGKNNFYYFTKITLNKDNRPNFGRLFGFDRLFRIFFSGIITIGLRIGLRKGLGINQIKF